MSAPKKQPVDYSVPEVAEFVHVAKSTVWLDIANRELKAVKTPKGTRVRAEDLENYRGGSRARQYLLTINDLIQWFDAAGIGRKEKFFRRAIVERRVLPAKRGTHGRYLVRRRDVYLAFPIYAEVLRLALNDFKRGMWRRRYSSPRRSTRHYNVAEAATFAQQTERQIRYAIDMDKLQKITGLGRSVRISRQALLKYLKSGTLRK
jgi:hypothetical protein